MAPKWSALNLELAIQWGEPVHGDHRRALERGLRDAVRAGRLAAGEVLPGSRALALSLGLARGTVVEAYEQLIAEGYLDARSGSGTVVSAAAARNVVNSSDTRPSAPRYAIDLRPGVPDLGSFPAEDWAWALARAARKMTRADLGYGNASGHAFAREAIAAALRRTRAAETTAAHIVLGSGFAQCLSLALGALAERGVRTIAVEDPGDRSVDFIARSFGMAVRGIPVDREGLDIAALSASNADATVVTPAHHAPTGAVLSPARRAQLIAWADRAGRWILEDDYDSEFRYDRQPVGVLQGIAPDRVLLLGSTSKTHAPAVRLGWIAAPADLLPALSAGKEAADRGSSALDQYAFGLLLDSGRHDRHVRGMRSVYKRRRSTLISALAQATPPLRLTGVGAGFHGLLRLPGAVDEDTIVRQAAQRSLALRGLGSFSLTPPTTPTLAIGFGNADDEQILAGVRIIEDLTG